MKTLSKAELSALVAQQTAGVAVKKIKTGTRSLDLTDREWAERVKMSKEECMAYDTAMQADDDAAYREFEAKQQDAWARRFAA